MEILVFGILFVLASLTLSQVLRNPQPPQNPVVYVVIPTGKGHSRGDVLLGLLIFGTLVLWLMSVIPS